MDFKEQIRTSVSPYFQIVLAAISISLLIGLLFYRSSLFTAREVHPKINPITPQKFQDFGGFSNTATVGLFINQFINFDMVTDEFIFDGTLWFKFDPGIISTDILDKFSFEKGTIIEKSAPTMKLIDNKLLVQYNIRVKFASELNYSDFPIDSHKIYIILTNSFISPSEILFDSSRREFTVEANVQTSGWNLLDQSVETGYLETTLDPFDARETTDHPAILFELDYGRNTIRYSLSILLPLALIFYLMLFSISLRLISAISITAGGITAILAYRFVIENLSPKTGFFMLSDYLFFLFLAATIGIFILNVFEERVVLEGQVSIEISTLFKKFFIIFMHVIVIGIASYLILR